jgi:cell division protease FtsH
MEAEEQLIELMGNSDEETAIGTLERRARRHERLASKNKAAIDRFLGKKAHAYEVGIVPRYYGELLAWALQRYMEKEGWQLVQTLGYHGREPVYIDVDIGCKQRENLLRDGQLLVQRGEDRFIVTVDINLIWRNSILVEGAASKEKQASSFVAGVITLMKEQNFYRGKKIEFAGRLRLLDLGGRKWDIIILDADIKREIRANTVGFLSKTELWSGLGIPAKRGILLAGDPGTGKTIICKALMAEAEGITCITASAHGLSDADYITELYGLAQDLTPCLVFIEDIDLIGQDREQSGYHNAPALFSLLADLDGIEEKSEIVTVATTNCLETLDRALTQRPARFDRVIKLTKPSQEQRRELINRLCERISLEEPARDYIVRHSEGYTPAQLQEIIFSLAIEYGKPLHNGEPLPVTTGTIDRVMSRINGKNKGGLGYRLCHDGYNPASLLSLNQASKNRIEEEGARDGHNRNSGTHCKGIVFPRK